MCGFSASLMAFSREVWLQQGSSLFREIQGLCHVLKKTILQHGPFVLLCLAPQECLGSIPFLLDAIFYPSLPLDLLGYTCMHIKQFSLGKVDRTETCLATENGHTWICSSLIVVSVIQLLIGGWNHTYGDTLKRVHTCPNQYKRGFITQCPRPCTDLIYKKQKWLTSHGKHRWDLCHKPRQELMASELGWHS